MDPQLELAVVGREEQPLASAAGALERVAPSRASMVHAFDVMRGDFLVVDARGEAAEAMVLQRSAKADPLLRVAVPKGEPFPWNDLRRAPVTRLARKPNAI